MLLEFLQNSPPTQVRCSAGYQINASSSALVQPSPRAPAYSLPWAATGTATVTTQPPACRTAAEQPEQKDQSDRLPKSRLSPYFSHRVVTGSSIFGRLRGTLSSKGSDEKVIAPNADVRRNVLSSMSDSSIAFSGGAENILTKEGESISIPPVALRRISGRSKDPACSSASPSTTGDELALGLSNLTITDESELKRDVCRNVSDGRSSSTSSGGGGISVVMETLATVKTATAPSPTLPPPATAEILIPAVTAQTTPTADLRAEFRVPMISPDGKLVGYKQNSSMLRRQMQVSMPFSDVDTTTPPESPMFMVNNSFSNTGKNSAEDFYLIASQDPFAGFPDAENQLPGYLLGPVVGRGGFSSVHKGLHMATSLPVAVKVIDKTRMRDPKDRDRVDREMRVMRQLSGHIGIAQLLECSETPRYLYIIMEYCAGGSLLDHVREKRKLSEKEACWLFQQILAALQHCHGRGVVHRDIKLENILLDGHGGVKLIDFGLCGYYVPDKPLRCHCGSPSYAAPEIVARKDYLAGPVDVWSAGVVLFAMLAGYLPFQGKDKKSLSIKIIKATWTPPSCASPVAIDLLEKMLTLDPSERICLHKIWEHPWVVNGPRWECNGEGPNGVMRTSVDPEIADTWVLLNSQNSNVTMAKLLRALRLKECNATTAGYHLLCQAKNDLESNRRYNNYIESSSDDDGIGDDINTKSSGTGESCVTAATSSDLEIFI